MGFLRRRNIFHGTGQAPYTPVATTLEWVTTPESVTLDAIGATAQVLARVLDQHGNALNPQPVINYSSGTPANISIVGRTLTAEDNGTSLITVSSASVSNITGTATVAQIAVRVEIEEPISPSVVVGGTLDLVAVTYDRLDVAMESQPAKTWDSADDLIATVNVSTGQVTGVAEGNVEIEVNDGSFIDTINISCIDAGTGFMGAVAGAIPIVFEDPTILANDAAFKARVSSSISYLLDVSKKGTGSPGSSTYSSGANADLITLTDGIGPAGVKALRAVFKAQNTNNQTPNPELTSNLDPSQYTTRLWIARELRWSVGWSNNGNATSPEGISWNASQGAGCKTGPWAGFDGADGRAGIEMEVQNYNIENLPKVGGINYGIVASKDGIVLTEWTDNAWYTEVILLESYDDGSGNIYQVATAWRKLTSDPNSSFVRFGPRLANKVSPSITAREFNSWQWTNKNYNRSRSTDQYRDHCRAGAWDANDPLTNGSDDPFGLLALDADHAPFTPVSLTLVSSTNETVIIDVKLTRDYPDLDASYARFLRPVVNGVDQPLLDVSIPYGQSEARIDTNANAGVFRASFTLAAGTYSIAFKAVNLNKSEVSTSSPTLSGVEVTGGIELTSLSPSTIIQGDTENVTFTGSGFTADCEPEVDPATDITISNIIVVGPTSITADVAVGALAATGIRDAIIKDTVTLEESNTESLLISADITYPTLTHADIGNGGRIFGWSANSATSTTEMRNLVVYGNTAGSAPAWIIPGPDINRVTFTNAESTYGKAAVFDTDMLEEGYVQGGLSLDALYMRTIERFENYTTTILSDNQRDRLCTADFSTVARTETNGSGTAGTMLIGGAVTASTALSGAEVLQLYASATFIERIFCCYKNVDNTWTVDMYLNAVGAARTLFKSITTVATAPSMLLGTFLTGKSQSISAGVVRYVLLKELINARLSGGGLLSINDVGT